MRQQSRVRTQYVIPTAKPSGRIGSIVILKKNHKGKIKRQRPKGRHCVGNLLHKKKTIFLKALLIVYIFDAK